MSAMEKSDLPEVARKRANKAASAAAEPVERRGGAKENADLQSTVRTQSREAVSRAQGLSDLGIPASYDRTLARRSHAPQPAGGASNSMDLIRSTPRPTR